MPALDLTAAIPGTVANTQLSAVAGNVRRIELPRSLSHDLTISFYPRTTAAKLLDTNATTAEDGAIGATAYATLPADQWTEVRIGADQGTIRRILASAAANQVVEIEINLAGQS